MAHDALLNIIIVEEDTDISRMLSFAVESQFGITPIEAQRAEDGLTMLDTMNCIDLVILGSVPDARDLLDRILAMPETDTPKLIISTENKISNPSVLFNPNLLGVFGRRGAIQEVPMIMRQELLGGELAVAASAREYCRVPAQLLLRMPKLPTDIYIRLSDSKVLKLFKQGDVFDSGDLEKYEHVKRVDHFYVRAEAVPGLLEECEARIVAILDNETIEDRLLHSMANELQETLHGLVTTLGATEEAGKIAQTNVKVIMKSVGKEPQLADIYRRFSEENGKYIITHSVILAAVACILAANVSWLSTYTFQKLVFAALFHDITLKNHELAKVRTVEEALENRSLLIEDTLEGLTQHPIHAAELLSKIENCPPDVDSIVRQHHERPDGTGFPSKVTHKNLTPLSCLFIMAHDYVDRVLIDKRSKLDFFVFLNETKDIYSQGFFRKIALSLTAAQTSQQGR